MAEFSASKYSDHMWESSIEVIEKLASGLDAYTVSELQIQYTFTADEKGPNVKANVYDTRTMIRSLTMSREQTSSLADIVRNCSTGVYDPGSIAVAGTLFPRTLWLEHDTAESSTATSASGDSVAIKSYLNSMNDEGDDSSNPAFDVCNITCHGIPLFEAITINVLNASGLPSENSVTVPASTGWPKSTGEMRWDMTCRSSAEVRRSNCCAKLPRKIAVRIAARRFTCAHCCPCDVSLPSHAVPPTLVHFPWHAVPCPACSPPSRTIAVSSHHTLACYYPQQGPKVYVTTQSVFVATQFVTKLFGATGVVGLYTLLLVVLARSLRASCTNKEKEVPYTTWYQTGYLLTICENIMAARALEAVNPAKKPFLLFSPDAVARTFDLCTCSKCVGNEVASLFLFAHTHTRTRTHTPSRSALFTLSNSNALCDWIERGCTKEATRDSEADGAIDGSFDGVSAGIITSAISARSEGSESTAAIVLHAGEESAAEESGAYSEWLAIEEKLFRHLVDVYRQPAELYRLTGRYEHWWDEKDDAKRQR